MQHDALKLYQELKHVKELVNFLSSLNPRRARARHRKRPAGGGLTPLNRLLGHAATRGR